MTIELRERLKDNAFSRRDYWVAVPVAVMWLSQAYCYVRYTDWSWPTGVIGGMVGIAFLALLLMLPIVYSRATLFVIPSFLLMGLANFALESMIGGDKLTLKGTIAFIAPAILSVVVWLRFVSDCRKLSSVQQDLQS